LVDINRNAAHTARDDIRDAHQGGIWIDTIVIGTTLLLAGVVALLFLRLLRRQRELMAVHLASLDERASDLEPFAARTSHDLKGPLSPLRGYSDMLAEDQSPRVRELASRIRRAVDRMTGIVDELLSVSTRGKALAGRVGLRPVVLELLEELE